MDSLQNRKQRFTGHIWKRKEELLSKAFIWEPKHLQKKWRLTKAYVDQLKINNRQRSEELIMIMGDSEE